MTETGGQARDPTVDNQLEEIVKGKEIPLCGNCVRLIQELARLQRRYPGASTECSECKGIVKLNN